MRACRVAAVRVLGFGCWVLGRTSQLAACWEPEEESSNCLSISLLRSYHAEYSE